MKSMKQRILSIKTYQGQRKMLSSWVEDWEESQNVFMKRLRSALEKSDYAEAMRIIDQMDNATGKRFSALKNIISVICEPGRELIEESDCVSITSDPNDTEKDIRENNMYDCIAVTDVEDIVKRYKSGATIREISEYNNMSNGKVIKILVTAGVYESDTYTNIKSLRDKGKSDEEIMSTLRIGRTAMDIYKPYKKGIYKSQTPSVNAMRIRKMRNKRKEQS